MNANGVEKLATAVERLLGVSWTRLITLMGPTAFALWIYGHLAWPNASDAPLAVYGRIAAFFGLGHAWAGTTESWLGQHPGVGSVCLITSIALGCLGSQPSKAAGARLTLAVFSLLVAMQVQGPGMLFVYLAGTAGVMVAAMLIDRRAEQQWSSRWISLPQISFQRWVVGAGSLLWLGLGLPLFLLFGMIEAFRVERPVDPVVPSGAAPVKLAG